jgi:ABC-type sugar transport system substrate-binding protein
MRIRSFPALAALGLASCGHSEKPSSASRTIGVSLLTMTNPFFKEIADTMEAEGKGRGFSVIATARELDPARQKDQVKDFLVKKVSAIVLAPCDSKSIGTSIAEANAAGVPVFTADVACMAPGVRVVAHVATDNLEGGRLARRAMVEMLGGKGKVASSTTPRSSRRSFARKASARRSRRLRGSPSRRTCPTCRRTTRRLSWGSSSSPRSSST